MSIYTLIIYTMDGFQNEEQAGTCIFNFCHHMTHQLREEQCFCSDRVGILVESSKIPESVKDAKKNPNLLYDVGDIIHLGMNEGAYAAQQELIKTDDYLTVLAALSKRVKKETFLFSPTIISGIEVSPFIPRLRFMSNESNTGCNLAY